MLMSRLEWRHFPEWVPVDGLIKEGFTHIVDADLSQYFGAPGDRQETDGESPLR
jgi:hypothetical protein